MSSQAVPFPQWLKETMEHRGLNQPRLGPLVGVHKNSVNRWVRGERSPALARMPTHGRRGRRCLIPKAS